MNENEETFTVTVSFKDEKERSIWLKDTLSRSHPQFADHYQAIIEQPMAKNIVLTIDNSEKEETSEEQKDVQLKLPFGKPLNCS